MLKNFNSIKKILNSIQLKFNLFTLLFVSIIQVILNKIKFNKINLIYNKSIIIFYFLKTYSTIFINNYTTRRSFSLRERSPPLTKCTLENNENELIHP